MASLEQNFPGEHKNPSMRRPRDVTDLAKQKEAERKKESILVRSLSFPLADLTRQKEAERRKESEQVAISIGEEEISSEEEKTEMQPSLHNSSNADSDDDQSETNSDDDVTSPIGQNVNPGHDSGPENHEAPRRRDGSKIEVLELIFFVANFMVELMSTVFDQLSSQHKASFLPCLIMSISAVLISISELVYKIIKEWDFRKGETNWRSWLFDHPPGAGVRVGFFPCIIALTCAFGQFIITTVSYSLNRKDGNAPIQVSIWSTIFAFGQFFSSLNSRGAKTEIKPKPKPEPELEPKPAPAPEPSLVPVPKPWPPPQRLCPPTIGQAESEPPSLILFESRSLAALPLSIPRRRPKPESAKPKGD